MGRPEHPITWADLCPRSTRCILLRGHTYPTCPGHPFEAAYRAQGMHTRPAHRGHLSQWATRNILIRAAYPRGVHAPSNPGAVLHTHCSHLEATGVQRWLAGPSKAHSLSSTKVQARNLGCSLTLVGTGGVNMSGQTLATTSYLRKQ